MASHTVSNLLVKGKAPGEKKEPKNKHKRLRTGNRGEKKKAPQKKKQKQKKKGKKTNPPRGKRTKRS